MGKYSKEEMELHLYYDYSGNRTMIWTNIPKYMSMIEKRGWTIVRREEVDGKVESLSAEVSKAKWTLKASNTSIFDDLGMFS